MQAAVRVIGREGLSGASLATVAAEAATSKPAVLYHFGSRDRLLHEVASLAFAMYRGLLPSDDDRPTRARTEAAIATIFAPENRNLSACVHELIGLGMRDSAVAELIARSLDDVLQVPIRALSYLGPDQARSVARSLVMTIQGHVQLWLCSDPADTKQFIESATRAALALIPES